MGCEGSGKDVCLRQMEEEKIKNTVVFSSSVTFLCSLIVAVVCQLLLSRLYWWCWWWRWWRGVVVPPEKMKLFCPVCVSAFYTWVSLFCWKKEDRHFVLPATSCFQKVLENTFYDNVRIWLMFRRKNYVNFNSWYCWLEIWLYNPSPDIVPSGWLSSKHQQTNSINHFRFSKRD